MIQHIIAVLVVFVWSSEESASQYSDCNGTLGWLHDGYCDYGNNNLACGYDGGDCCACTCDDGFEYACGDNVFNCLDPACPDEDPSPYPNCTPAFGWLSDGWCDPEHNTPACGFDGGDCCECNCLGGLMYPCGSNGFDCKDTACSNHAIGVEYPECAGNWLSIGDGSCSAENNNEECGYDGGDCCSCTCSGSACGLTGFDCSDPRAGDEVYDCKPPPPTSQICPADGKRVWVVEDSAQATALAEGVSCSGGYFEVLWKGNVVVDQTIYVLGGTFLNVTGASPISTMDGNSTTRLITVVNGSLHVTGVNMSYGAANVGGAVAAVRSSLSFTSTSFIGNAATGHGGAIYAGGSSLISLFGQCRFADNAASIDGGGVFVSDSQFSGENMIFLNNTAGNGGGALMVTDHSSVSWSSTAVYNGNRAGGAGGAICAQHGSAVVWSTTTTFQFNVADRSAGALALQSGSRASWLGETIFDSNTALHHAGAVLVRDASNVSSSATTIFRSNRAAFSGGALRVTNSSSASLAGGTTYANNSALYGGSMITSRSSITVSSGNTTYFSNTAGVGGEGGAVFVTDFSIAAWFGDTAFTRNSAGDGGAVYADYDSYLSYSGEAAFHGNLAVTEKVPGILQAGGAVYIRNSTLSLSGVAVFTDNQALATGGAVFAIIASVFMTGTLSFLNNSGGVLGGAVSIQSSTGVVDGNTTFDGNTAEYGGAVDARGASVLEWDGAAEFANNSALVGGSFSVFDSSNVSFSGNLTLINNRASVNGTGIGGGMSVMDTARVSWSGQASFLQNSADAFGGAVNVWQDAAVYWSGETTFSGCAASYGAAIYVTGGSTVEWVGRTEFSSNRAAISGGAVASHATDGGQASRGLKILINASTTFANNTARATGGGVWLDGKVNVTLQSPDVLFFGNSAEVAGGAISVSGLSDGPVFSDVRFVANFAGAGGAAFISASGNDEIGAAGTTPTSATRFDRCQFVQNTATATGGALESVAGQDYLSNTAFVSNTAGVGGALRLAGKVGLDNCSFVDNRSDEGQGPAVDNTGILSVIKGNSFVDNVFNCESGTYLDFSESANVFEVACNGCGALCQGCIYGESPLVPICIPTIEHASSSGGATTLATILIDPGFWRATSTSEDVLPCYRDDVCLGGVTGSTDYCGNGYEGPYCSICSEGYAGSFGFACNKCSDKTGGTVVAVVLVVVVLIGGAAVASYTMSSQLEGGGRGKIERFTRFVPLQSIKIVIVALQIVTQFTAIANITYSHVYQHFLDRVDVLNFDLGWISQLSVGCLFDVGIHGRLLIATIGPIIATMFLGLTYVVATRGSRLSAETMSLVRHRHASTVLLLTFLVYSSVSSILFQMFACDDLADGKNYLRADYRVECNSPTHRAFQVYAGFMILLYTVGLPTLYTSLLLQNRAVLTDEVAREASQSTQSFADLWKPYKPSVFYYEVIECCRRVLLTGAVVFIYPNTSAQIAVTLMIAFVFTVISEGLAPFKSRWDTWISRVGHFVVYVSMYVALLLKVDVSNERSSSQNVFEAVLVAAHLGMILAVVVETGIMICSLRHTVREGTSPRFRGTKYPFTR